MKLLTIYNNKIQLFGCSIFKRKLYKKITIFFICKLPLFAKKDIEYLIYQFKNNSSYDTRNIDHSISNFFSRFKFTFNKNQTTNSIAYLATEVYEFGGHSKCMRDLIQSLESKYNQFLFLTHYNNSITQAPKLLGELHQHAKIYGYNFRNITYKKQVKSLVNKILSIAPKVILVYIHPDDIFSAGILSLIKKYTNIKIIFVNHASHYPILGASFADLVLEGTPTTKAFTENMRNIYNCKIVGLQSLAVNETVYYSNQEKFKIKNCLGIPNSSLITMSGGASYKFFDKNNNSDYFHMIRDILNSEKKLYHVVMSNFDDLQKKIIDHIFMQYQPLKSRLILIPFQTNFDIYFQCADVFIDSFPVSGALTQIDLMRNRVCSVVKINPTNPEFSFEGYQMPEYPYMFETIQDMKKTIILLLHSPNKRQKIIDANYNFWLKTYEKNVVKNKFIEIIEESNRI